MNARDPKIDPELNDFIPPCKWHGVTLDHGMSVFGVLDGFVYWGFADPLDRSEFDGPGYYWRKTRIDIWRDGFLTGPRLPPSP